MYVDREWLPGRSGGLSRRQARSGGGHAACKSSGSLNLGHRGGKCMTGQPPTFVLHEIVEGGQERGVARGENISGRDVCMSVAR